MRKIIIVTCFIFIFLGCSEKPENLLELHIKNPAKETFIGVSDLLLSDLPGLTPKQNVIVIGNGNMIPSQWADKDGDGSFDVLSVEVNIVAQSTLSVEIVNGNDVKTAPSFPKKTQAELWHKTTGKFKEGRYVGGGNFSRFDSLRVPDGFMDHAYFIKYEGPGWESDKVGYRLYLDWRNAVDVFGKKVREPVLENVGMDGYESYHHEQDWGMDILKVGKSLGIGSIGWWNGEKAIRVEKTDSVICRVLADGIIKSQVQTWYYRWDLGVQKVNLNSVISIDAGSRMTHECLLFDAPVANICTGIRKEPKGKVIQIKGENEKWACLATWGKQSLNNDLLGLAIIYPNQHAELTEDKHSHIVQFKKPSTQVEYYFLAAWEKEPNGIKSEEAFVKYIKEELNKLETPLIITKVENHEN